jgi:protein involved in polysaccharide export with SLBB domain
VGLERNLEINWDYAVVQRLNPADLTSRLLSFNLGRALADANSSDNLVLEAGDVVTIFSRDDLGVPAEKRSKLVWIEGEVKAAGIYRAEPGETLRDLVVRAGGLTGQAYLFAADFRRDSVRREQEQKLQAMVSKMEQEMRSRAAEVAARGNAEERQAGRDEMEAERSLLEKLRQTRPTGRIVLNLKPKDMSALALPELPLEDGDRLTIPPRPSTLQVVGEVYNQSAFIYAPGKTIGDYLGQSGGATHSADTGRMFLIRADGSVLSKQMRHSLWGGRLESLRPLPGDTIVMPERIRTSSLLRGMRDWSQVFAQFALGAAAVRVISP